MCSRRYARIQEFPDNWIFCGKTAEKYKQIGNAVPVRLGQVTAEVVSRLLDATAKDSSVAAYRKATTRFRQVYINSHVRTRKWYKAGEVFAGGEALELAYAGK